MSIRDRPQLRHRCGVPKQVDGHDRPRAWRYRSLNRRRIELIRTGVDIGKDRRGANRTDRLGRCVEGIGRADDLIAGANPVGAQRADQGVSAVGNANRVRHAEVSGRLGLKGLDVWTEDKHAATNNVVNGSRNAVVERLPLAAQIHQWNAHVRQDTAPIGMGR